MLTIEFSGQFKRDYKAAIKRGCSQSKFEEILSMLQNQIPLPKKTSRPRSDRFAPLQRCKGMPHNPGLAIGISDKEHYTHIKAVAHRLPL